ncbi:4Fe-4S dicluster domain-containing protein [Clostridium nigeriense]|uniref:4Fe-4S dicluster domain-containing protein n=1 Tax=Clostridium nigeriense TaxID=1805470 RepID=UPI003D329DD3
MKNNIKESRNIPVLFNREIECCGCTACMSICPVSSISMQGDKKGFLYPIIDENRCIKCQQCLRVCPI